MRIECIKDVVVSGKTVYVEGNEYKCEVIRDEAGKLVSHNITGVYGMGVFLAGDPALEQFFKVESESVEPVSEPVVEEKPHGMGKILNFFRKSR